MRLIDADALKIELALIHGGDYKTIHYLNHAPTVDAVPVIRCKDCKHYKKDVKCVGGHYGGCDVWLDEGCETPVDEEGYCSYAERKEE